MNLIIVGFDWLIFISLCNYIYILDLFLFIGEEFY